MKKTYLVSAVTVLTAGILAACNSNESDGVVTLAPTTAPTATLTVIPSLGKINNARVVLRKAATNAVIGSPAIIGASGVVQFKNVPVNAGPVVVEVQGVDGAQNATYFDESANANVNFPASEKIRAVVPAVSGNVNVGVTVLTELATQVALKKAGNDLTKVSKEIATEANKVVRDALAKELGSNSLLTPPTLIGRDTVVKDAITARNAANDYALKLASLAKLGSGSAPVLDALEKLAADISDDKLDGKNGANPVGFNLNGNADLFAAVSAYLSAYANQVQINTIYSNAVLANFSFLSNGSFVININSGGGGGSGANCKINVSAFGAPVMSICYSNFPGNSACGAGDAALSAALAAYQGQIAGGSLSFSTPASCAGSTITVNWQ